MLLLDEPAVGLDAHAEHVVVQPLARLTEGRTVITSTRRPALTALTTRGIYLHSCAVLDGPPPRPQQVAGTAR